MSINPDPEPFEKLTEGEVNALRALHSAWRLRRLCSRANATDHAHRQVHSRTVDRLWQKGLVDAGELGVTLTAAGVWEAIEGQAR